MPSENSTIDMVKSNTIPKTQAPLWLIWVTNWISLTFLLLILFDFQATNQLPFSPVKPGVQPLRTVTVLPPTVRWIRSDFPTVWPVLRWGLKKVVILESPSQSNSDNLLLTMIIRYGNSINPPSKLFPHQGQVHFCAFIFGANNLFCYYFLGYLLLTDLWIVFCVSELFVWGFSAKTVCEIKCMDQGKGSAMFSVKPTKLPIEWQSWVYQDRGDTGRTT